MSQTTVRAAHREPPGGEMPGKPAGVTAPRRTMVVTPVAAGAAFAASWVAGLSVWSASTDVRSDGARIVAAYAGHEGVASLQFLLTEGIASLALAVVAIAVGRAGLVARPRPGGRSGARACLLAGLTTAAGLTAAAIGLVQCGIGLYLTSSVVPAGQADSAAVLTEAINRLDGVKMFVLAAMAIAGTVMAIETGLLPRWLRWTGVALAAAIVASGVGYAFLNAAMAMAAWLSLPLLIVWVAGSGIVVSRRARVTR